MSASDKSREASRRVAPEGRAPARPDSSPYRKHPIHLSPRERHNLAIIIFVTACTAKRRRILASPAAHEAILAAWHRAMKWRVGRYVIMPDHVHFFCAPNEFHPSSLEKWMSFWKSNTTRYLGEIGGSVWQRHHWDRQLRRAESYDDKWEYVRSNPVRHGLFLRWRRGLIKAS